MKVENRPELYKETIGILYDSYFNNTLEHGNCYACAVGNIIAANCGYKFVSLKEVPTKNTECVYTGLGILYWENAKEFYDNPVLYLGATGNHDAIEDVHIKQIEKTGYSILELDAIEIAFEQKRRDDKSKDDNMFNGLVAVLEVLKQIHQVEDDSESTCRFKEHFLTLPK